MMAKVDQNKGEIEQILLNDVLAFEHEADNCEHTMDSLDFIDWEYKGDKVECLHRCSCGKKVTEIFSHIETRISD